VNIAEGKQEVKQIPKSRTGTNNSRKIQNKTTLVNK